MSEHSKVTPSQRSAMLDLGERGRNGIDPFAVMHLGARHDG